MCPYDEDNIENETFRVNNKDSDEEKDNTEVVEEFEFCTKCGGKNKKGATICTSCGCMINGTPGAEKKDDIVKCPNCGSTQIEFVTYQASQNFSAGSACCGILLCGPIGTLCGIGPKTPAQTKRKCKACGKEF